MTSPSAAPPPGIYVPVPTFFVSKSASNYNSYATPLDLQTQAAHAIHLAKCGIRGLVVLGSTGEAIMITNEERKTLLRHVRQEMESAGFKDYPIIAGTATQSIEDTVQQLNDAKEAGSQWGLVLAPGYFAPALTQSGLIDWYTAIADNSPIPIMIYHYPAVSNNISILPPTFETLSLHPNIVGCKLSHGDLSRHAQVASSPTIDASHFATFTGLGQQLLSVLTVGGAGAIDGLAGIFPRTVVRLFDLYTQQHQQQATQDGNNNSASTTQMSRTDEMRNLQYHIARGEELVLKWSTVGIKEGVSRILGFGERDGTRLPLKGGLPEGEWAQWEEVMGALKGIEERLAGGKVGG